MRNYTVRRASLADADVLVHQRVRMFEDMGAMSGPDVDATAVAADFRAWLSETMPSGQYVAWVVEHASATAGARIVAGGGATIIPWPPGPRYPGRQLAFVYNVYTEPAHRGQGLARRVMDAIHAYCRAARIRSVALNASAYGQPLYESMGYRVTSSPMMFLSLD
jgi:GNAT superfamily N-acetyltransferase